MSAPKNVTRLHFQHQIYLPRPQSLAIVLEVFKLNYQVKRDKGGKNLEKACTRGSAINTEACDVIHVIFIQCF